MATIIEDPTSDVAAVMAALNESANAILAEQLEQLAQ
jgi:hypothetical protein